MYLQGVRGLSPFDSALLLLPGYVIGSMLGPYFGRLADRIGSRIPATVGILMMAGAIIVYSLITVNSTLYIVLIASGNLSCLQASQNRGQACCLLHILAIKAMHYQTGIIPSHPANTL